VSRPTYPFSAVVGHDQAKLALVLAALDPAIGGVLLRGEKGSAKTTLARGLAGLLPGQAPFVELPLGATEDRVVGTIDLRAALTSGERSFQPGLLSAAHGGVLYVDEVNLLADHLVDLLLDVAASGVNRVEREGVSAEHPSRFVLVGSMNPEEGELRPQLLDRFGLSVEVCSSTDPGERSEAVQRRLAFDADPDGFCSRWLGEERSLAARLASASCGPARPLAPELVRAASALCVELGAEGLRADIVLCRAARALAAWEANEPGLEHLSRVAPLALAHRRRRHPLEPAGLPPGELEAALQRLGSPGGQARPESRPEAGTGEGAGEQAAPGAGEGSWGELSAPRAVPRPPTPRQSPPAPGRGERSAGRRGRQVGAREPEGPPGPVAVTETVVASVQRRAGEGPGAAGLAACDLREAVREGPAGTLVVLCVDASGSMGARQRLEAAKGAALGLLVDAYRRRDRLAVVSFRQEAAEVVLRPTASVEVARARLEQLPVGGRTPLWAGLRRSLEVARAHGGLRPLVVVISDGRATAGPPGADPLEAAMEAAREVRRARVRSLVVDAEGERGALGLARRLAQEMGADYLALDQLAPGPLEAGLRSRLG
jgi:magnesium chelatase subunit D